MTINSEQLRPYVRLSHALICANCETISEAQTCPSCCSTQLVPLQRWLDQLPPFSERWPSELEVWH